MPERGESEEEEERVDGELGMAGGSAVVVVDRNKTLRNRATDFFRARHVTRESGSKSRTSTPLPLSRALAAIHAFPSPRKGIGG